jgi:sporulation protein YlmC with PRC-barrel domain
MLDESEEDIMQDPSKIKNRDPDKKYRRVLAASTLAGDQVQNSAGEDLGKVDEIMIDIPAGKVAYAVLSFGGFLGMGNKLFAVPWSALRVDEDKKHFILDVDKKKLENAPGFDKDNWPDMADTSWGTRIFSYYGAEPYWETHKEEKTFRGGGGGL